MNKEDEHQQFDLLDFPNLEVPTTPTPTTKAARRPNGTTKDAKYNLKIWIHECRNAAAAEFHEQKNIAKRYVKYVFKKGRLEIHHKGTKRKIRVTWWIYSRHYRGKLEVTTMAVESPMVATEPKLVELIIRMSRFQRCLTPSQCLQLANDLIEALRLKNK